MRQPTETALKGRARRMLEIMSERTRWVYAVPREEGDTHAAATLEEAGLACQERDEAARVTGWGRAGADATFVLFSNAELDVMLVTAVGEEAPEILAKLLDRTGFYAQTQLLKTALDVRDEEAGKALRTLAHMVVAWDEDWFDLFLLHLASPDPIVRHDAVASVSLAAMVARDGEPAVRLLEEALSREKFPKLRETIGEAIAIVRGATGGPVTPTP